jgi:hypothetical protein
MVVREVVFTMLACDQFSLLERVGIVFVDWSGSESGGDFNYDEQAQR